MPSLPCLVIVGSIKCAGPGLTSFLKTVERPTSTSDHVDRSTYWSCPVLFQMCRQDTDTFFDRVLSCHTQWVRRSEQDQDLHE